MDFGFMSQCALESVKCNKNEDLIINKNNPFNEKKNRKVVYVAMSKIFVEPIIKSLSEQSFRACFVKCWVKRLGLT